MPLTICTPDDTLISRSRPGSRPMPSGVTSMIDRPPARRNQARSAATRPKSVTRLSALPEKPEISQYRCSCAERCAQRVGGDLPGYGNHGVVGHVLSIIRYLDGQ